MNKFIFINENYTLQVKDAKFDDTGDYECEAVNELGGAVAYATLTVGCKYLLKRNGLELGVVVRGGEHPSI